ncbi:MAG TPA: hypothetical protein VML55_26780 [Planctomycetaceae bacterium]|nr:hypothetical protein [Planctomycetaceae bacterium]
MRMLLFACVVFCASALRAAGPELPRGAVLRLEDGPAAGDVTDERSPVRNLAVSADGAEIVIGGPDGSIAVWDAQTGQCLRRLKTDSSDADPAPISALALARNGAIVARAGDALVRWNADGSRSVVRFEGLGDGPRLAAISPDGRLFAEYGEGSPIGVWDAGSGRRLLELDETVRADLLEFSPDGRRLAVARMVRLYLFDVDPDGSAGRAAGRTEPLWKQRPEGTIRHLRFSRDGASIATLVDYEGLLVIDAVHGSTTPPPTVRRTRGGGGERKLVTVSPDASLVAESDGRGEVRLWEFATARDVLLLRPRQAVAAAAFLPDGRRLVTVAANGTGLVWDLASADFAIGLPSDIPLDSETAAALWRQLGDDNGEAAWQALVALLHRPGEALRLLESPPSLDGLARRLVSQLDSEDSSLRSLAMRRLADMSVAAEAFLRDGLDGSPSPEAAARLRRLLRRLSGPDKQSEVEKLARARQFRRVRAVRLLEWIDTPEARRLLVRLSEERDPDASR